MSKTRVARGVLASIGLVGLAGLGLAQVIATPEIVGIRDQEVKDLEVAREYLVQEVQLYLPDLSAEIEGDFEYRPVSGVQVDVFLRQQGIIDEAWTAAQPEAATMVSWTSPGARFAAPRPRAGFDASLDGDTFFIILAPEGLKLTGVVPAAALAPLRVATLDTVTEELTVRPKP